MDAEPVLGVLRALGAPHALIGAHAMAARGYPRFTVDIDLLTTDDRVLSPSTWTELTLAGASVEPRAGEHDDPLGGVVHILLADGTDVDLLLARWKWEADVISRSETMSIGTVSIPVPRTSDLILLKLAAGGYGDRQDAAALLALGDVDSVIGEVETHIGDVRPDVRPLWLELRAALRR